MSGINTNTVIRKADRKLLKALFESCECLPDIDFEHAPRYVLLETYATMPLERSARIQRVLLDIMFFASGDDILAKAVEAALECGYILDSGFDVLKNRYDKAIYLYCNCHDIWAQTLLFAKSDEKSAQTWYHATGLPKMSPRHDEQTIRNLENNCSAQFWQKQHRGDSCHIEYHVRNNGLHYFFVYLNNYPEVKEVWEKREENQANGNKMVMIRREENFSFSVVFIYNQELGVLETCCMGGRKYVSSLERIFCEHILTHDLKDTEIIKNVYAIDDLKYRKNQLRAMPEIGVLRARISGMELHYRFTKGKKDVKYMAKDDPDSAIYDAFDREYNGKNVHMNLLRVAWVQLELDILVDGNVETLFIFLRRNVCTLKSNSEHLRRIGEKYLQETGVDVQPSLF